MVINNDEELWNIIKTSHEQPSHIIVSVTDIKSRSIFQDVTYGNLIAGNCRVESMILKHDQEINSDQYIKQIHRY